MPTDFPDPDTASGCPYSDYFGYLCRRWQPPGQRACPFPHYDGFPCLRILTMEIDTVRELCLAVHPQVTEDVPFEKFGSGDIAFRICGKIFAFLLVDGSRMVVLKCEPERALELRDRYPGIIEPAFHWNKKYWNQVRYNSPALPRGLVAGLITHAFEEVVSRLPRKTRSQLLSD